MVYDIQWTVIAEKQFSKLDKVTKKRISDKLVSIRDDPFSFVKKLTGFEAYKLRVGDYRVILTIENNTLVILILKVGHRRSVYK
jgi:mRNA interferase RelE/StbE